MPRPRKRRWVSGEPGVDYFKPQGVPVSSLEEVVLTVGEYEALRLADLEGMPQAEAAGEMNVSQSTFFRLLRSARSKVSEAIVGGKALRIEGGDYVVRPRGGRRMGGAGRGAGGAGRGRGGGGRFPAGPTKCVCPKCGKEMPHPKGVRCLDLKCPECGTPMLGGSSSPFQPKR